MLSVPPAGNEEEEHKPTTITKETPTPWSRKKSSAADNLYKLVECCGQSSDESRMRRTRVVRGRRFAVVLIRSAPATAIVSICRANPDRRVLQPQSSLVGGWRWRSAGFLVVESRR
ncbi:unnamed protein product [Amoebophrya sp. A120]|nr:unnamed protein product [Amoebophrya sp. A120]|eukprot:GSA120T00024860001.1